MHSTCHRFLLDQPSPSSPDVVAVLLVFKDKQDKPIFKHGASRTAGICTSGFRNTICFLPAARWSQLSAAGLATSQGYFIKGLLQLKEPCKLARACSSPAQLHKGAQLGTFAAFKPCTGKLGLARPLPISYITSFNLLHAFRQRQLPSKLDSRPHGKLLCTLNVGCCIRQSRRTCNLHPATYVGFL